MTIKIIVQLLLLPLVIVAVPLIFSLAWIAETIGDLTAT